MTEARHCSIEGCEQKYLCRGLCRNHYYRLFKYGDPLAGFAFSNKGITCEADGCEKPATSKRLCRHHYGLLRNHGDANWTWQQPHGTRSAYQYHGCRCDECKAAHKADQKRVHDKLRKQEPPQHGTHSAYTNYGCRCAPCKEAGSRYNIWFSMIDRCHNPDNPSYEYYGARGIKVCDRWRYSIDAFWDDMGPRPAGYTIERINNDGDYEPSNCKWATYKEQAQNKRPRGTVRKIKRPSHYERV